MKIVKFTLLAIIILTIIKLCESLIFNDTARDCNHISPDFININGEIHHKFLLLDDGGIVFSINDSNSFSLEIYRNGEIEQLMTNSENVINPVLISGNISALQDFNGNDEYKPTNAELLKYTGSSFVKSLYSFKHGDLILVQFLNENGVFLINLKDKTKKKLLEFAQKLHGAAFSEKGNYLIISCDDKLIYAEESGNSFYELASGLNGEKLNPYVFDDCVYFVNNSISEYYRVYMINIKKSVNDQIQTEFHLEHDIRVPKLIDNYLYFIELINSEYLLKRLNLTTQRIEEITKQGVVYNYDFTKEGKLVLVYSDIFNPKCLMIYCESEKSFKNISGSSFDHNLSFSLIKSFSGNSSAYLLKKINCDIKGVILFIHPIHSDFSPRWDAILMNLCNNGYIIIAPNYPMSSGYGKSYYNSSPSQALIDLIEWKEYILKMYNNLPLFCFSISSGNALMENLLVLDNKGIKCAVSLFGVPAEIYKESFSVPTLYILGENDQIVNFSDRDFILSEEKKEHSSISLVSYADEGHGFRKKHNLQDAVRRIINHFCLNSK